MKFKNEVLFGIESVGGLVADYTALFPTETRRKVRSQNIYINIRDIKGCKIKYSIYKYIRRRKKIICN